MVVSPAGGALPPVGLGLLESVFSTFRKKTSGLGSPVTLHHSRAWRLGRPTVISLGAAVIDAGTEGRSVQRGSVTVGNLRGVSL